MAVEFSFVVCRSLLCSLISYQLLPHVLWILHKLCWLNSSICEFAFQFQVRFWGPCVSHSPGLLTPCVLNQWGSEALLWKVNVSVSALHFWHWRKGRLTQTCLTGIISMSGLAQAVDFFLFFFNLYLLNIHRMKKPYRGNKKLTLFLSSLCSLLLSPTASSCSHPAGTTSSPDGGGDTGQWRCWHVLW